MSSGFVIILISPFKRPLTILNILNTFGLCARKHINSSGIPKSSTRKSKDPITDVGRVDKATSYKELSIGYQFPPDLPSSESTENCKNSLTNKQVDHWEDNTLIE